MLLFTFATCIKDNNRVTAQCVLLLSSRKYLNTKSVLKTSLSQKEKYSFNVVIYMAFSLFRVAIYF